MSNFQSLIKEIRNFDLGIGQTIVRHVYLFLFLRLLRCFSSPGSRLTILYIQIADAPSSTERVSPFGNPRVKGCLPPYRGLSQAATSFIVFLCQGIHHILLLRFSHTYIFKVWFCNKTYIKRKEFDINLFNLFNC
jgi:hypothetical protein